MTDLTDACCCITCGKTATIWCARGCGASYCSFEHQRTDWNEGEHREVCNAFQWWIGGDNDEETEQQSVGADPVAPKKKPFSLLPPPKADPNAAEPEMQLIAQAKTVTPATRIARQSWMQKYGALLMKILQQMRDLIRAGKKEKALTEPRKLSIQKILVKKWFAKIAIAGFQIGFNAVKLGGGIAAEVASVGAPSDEIVEAIATAIDVLLFAATTMANVTRVVMSLVNVGSHAKAILSFNGGPEGMMRAVDDMVATAGTKGAQLVGSFVGLYDGFITWGAPLVGDLVGLCIPSDVAAVGRVVQVFLTIVGTVAKMAAFGVMRLIWNILPTEWTNVLTSEENINGMLLGVVEFVRRVFPRDINKRPPGQRDIIEIGRRAFTTVARFHWLYIVGILKVETLDKTTRRIAQFTRNQLARIDHLANQWIDRILIPNLNKVSLTILSGFGMTYSILYMLSAYDSSGRKKNPTKVETPPAGAAVAAIRAQLTANESARVAFVADADQRLHEMRALLCSAPAAETLDYICTMIDAGVQLRADDPRLSVEPSDPDARAYFVRNKALMFGM